MPQSIYIKSCVIMLNNPHWEILNTVEPALMLPVQNGHLVLTVRDHANFKDIYTIGGMKVQQLV